MLDETATRDLSTRLTIFGVVSVALGCGLIALGLLHLALPGMLEDLDGERPVDLATALMGAVLYAMLGGVLVWAGIGSVRKRRWVRPIMLFISGTWLIVGLFVVLLVVVTVDDLILMAGGDLLVSSTEMALIVRTIMISGSVGFGLLLPGLFFWAYHGRGVEATCLRHSPEPGWSDRCPATVLALSASLAAAGLLGLPTVFRPVLPIFGRVATGWPAIVGLLMISVWCLWLAWSTFRLEREGWWGTLIFFLLLGLSTLVTAVNVDVLEFYRLLGYPEEQLDLLRPSAGPSRLLMIVGSVAFTVVGLVYVLGIRRHFFRTADR
jgi:hypothetical protein